MNNKILQVDAPLLSRRALAVEKMFEVADTVALPSHGDNNKALSLLLNSKQFKLDPDLAGRTRPHLTMHGFRKGSTPESVRDLMESSGIEQALVLNGSPAFANGDEPQDISKVIHLLEHSGIGCFVAAYPEAPQPDFSLTTRRHWEKQLDALKAKVDAGPSTIF